MVPGFPHEDVVDPTGAGDSFAGGLMGYIAGQDAVDMQALAAGVIHGTITSSFAIERFGPRGLEGLTPEAIQARLKEFLAATRLAADAAM